MFNAKQKREFVKWSLLALGVANFSPLAGIVGGIVNTPLISGFAVRDVLGAAGIVGFGLYQLGHL